VASEGAGGLSTTAIERCIDNRETETQDGAEIPAAHAELAALVERAGRVAALEGALLDETARRLWTERVLRDRHGSPVGWDWDVGPAVREHWTRVARERLASGRTVETLAELPARRDADPGRGAAGARDETPAVVAAAAVLLAVVNKGHRIRCPRYTASRDYAACTCGVDTVGDALDALRAGGAEGGADGGDGDGG
jgi:hypothetical protein